ncbi:MAG TPA: MarR family transcriptional regulator [Thermoplasmata archaeon]|nr:MarR family transcriptional regulator [Thermoplasmata archaeon]
MGDIRSDARLGPSVRADRLSETVGQVARGWIRIGREEARRLGLSLPQLFLLRGLRELGPFPASRWVDLMGSSPSALTGLLDGLESGGYIQRTHDREDRRQVLVSLSSKGRALADSLKEEFQARWRTYCSGIAPSRLETAADVLGVILERMGPIATESPHLRVAPRDRRRAS